MKGHRFVCFVNILKFFPPCVRGVAQELCVGIEAKNKVKENYQCTKSQPVFKAHAGEFA